MIGCSIYFAVVSLVLYLYVLPILGSIFQFFNTGTMVSYEVVCTPSCIQNQYVSPGLLRKYYKVIDFWSRQHNASTRFPFVNLSLFSWKVEFSFDALSSIFWQLVFLCYYTKPDYDTDWEFGKRIIYIITEVVFRI